MIAQTDISIAAVQHELKHAQLRKTENKNLPDFTCSRLVASNMFFTFFCLKNVLFFSLCVSHICDSIMSLSVSHVGCDNFSHSHT